MSMGVRPEMINQLHALASEQFGLITTRQAEAIGITAAMLRNAVAHGWLSRERRSVVALAGQRRSQWRSTYAAVLAAGPGAAISHTSAARIHSFHGIAGHEIELTVPFGTSPKLAGVRVHRSRTLLTSDVIPRHGALVTSPERTIIDLAGRFQAPLLGKIVDEGTITRLWTPESVAARANKVNGFPVGVSQLRRILAGRTGEGQPDSTLEQRVIRLVKRRFPGYAVHYQVVLDGQVIVMDIAWPSLKIDAEVDGMLVRSVSSSKFEQERRRQNVLGRHGRTIIHLTASMDDAAILSELEPLFGSNSTGSRDQPSGSPLAAHAPGSNVAAHAGLERRHTRRGSNAAACAAL